MDLQSELRLQSFWKIGNLVELLPRYWHSHQPLVAMRTGFLCEAHMLFVEEPHTTLFAEWSSSLVNLVPHQAICLCLTRFLQRLKQLPCL